VKAYEQAGHLFVELTRRNLQTLLDKLDDPASARMIYKTAEESDRQVFITAVEDAEHYGDRPPGAVFMPTSGEHR